MNERVNDFIKEFMCSGIELRYCGGAVRDFLLGVTPKDFDLATPSLPLNTIEVAQRLGYKVLLTGLDHGTITVIINEDLHVEITTLRVDESCDGRYAEVSYTTDWKKDSSRRDFQFNSMFMDHNGVIYDYFDGQEDLLKGIIKFVGNPDQRVKEDYLRILRFFRFATKFSDHFHFDEKSLDACIDNRKGLKQISGERIQSEMYKILTYKDPEFLLSLMMTAGILEQISMNKFDFNAVQRVSNYYEHSCHPNIFSILVATGSDIEPIIERWKLSNEDANQLRYLQKFTWKSFLPWKIENFEDDLVDEVSFTWVMQAAILCQFTDKSLNHLANFYLKRPVFPVTGKDLMETFGMKQGVTLGNTLKNLRSIWMDSRFTLTREQLLNKIIN